MTHTEYLYLVGVEGGGTTFVISIARLPSGDVNVVEDDDKLQIVHEASIPTSSPTETLKLCSQYIQEQKAKLGIEKFDGLGVASFGPLGLEGLKEGVILPTTPKKDWANVSVLEPLLEAASSSFSSSDGNEKNVPYRIDTDVNAPAWAEYQSTICDANNNNNNNNNNTISSLAYITVGTGVGVGLVINKMPVHGMMHPEGGHVCVQKLESDTFGGYSWGKGRTPYNGTCTIEGLASSVALVERLGAIRTNAAVGDSNDNREVLKDLEDQHEVWDHCANALANLCVSLVLLVSVEKIVIGGGIMNRQILYTKIRAKMKELLNGYVGTVHDMPQRDMELFITPSKYGNRAGIMGALSLAKSALQQQRQQQQHIRMNEKKTAGQNVRDDSLWSSGFLCGLALSACAATLYTLFANKPSRR